MKLLTHNLLQSHIKGVKEPYPLGIEATKVEVREQDFEPDFLRHIFPRINWDALRAGAAAMGVTDLPAAASEADLESDEFMKAFHHALLEVHLEEGALVCPETGRKFPVSAGIPNLLLTEDEC